MKTPISIVFVGPLNSMIPKFETYYAVIFTSSRTEGDNGYSKMSELMEKLAKEQVGYLGMESARNELGITVSYWKSLEAIKVWKQQTDHLIAQRKGRSDWYQWYKVRICKVKKEYEFGIYDKNQMENLE